MSRGAEYRIIRFEFVDIPGLEYKMQRIDMDQKMRAIASEITDICRLSQKQTKPRRGAAPMYVFEEGAFGLFIKKGNRMEWLGDTHTIREFGIKDRTTLYFRPIMRGKHVYEHLNRILNVDHFGRVVIFTSRCVVELPDNMDEVCKERVLDMDFSDNYISRIPKCIGKMDKLENFKINNNRLVRLPDEIGKCGNLRKLSVQSNRLVELPACLSKLHLLSTINVKNNRIKTLPVELGELLDHQLNEIVTFGNPLTDPPPKVMGMGIQKVLRYLQEKAEGHQ